MEDYREEFIFEDQDYISFYYLSYDELMNLAKVNRRLFALVSDRGFWNFRVRKELEGCEFSERLYFREALYRGEYFIIRALLERMERRARRFIEKYGDEKLEDTRMNERLKLSESGSGKAGEERIDEKKTEEEKKDAKFVTIPISYLEFLLKQCRDTNINRVYFNILKLLLETNRKNRELPSFLFNTKELISKARNMLYKIDPEVFYYVVGNVYISDRVSSLKEEAIWYIKFYIEMLLGGLYDMEFDNTGGLNSERVREIINHLVKTGNNELLAKLLDAYDNSSITVKIDFVIWNWNKLTVTTAELIQNSQKVVFHNRDWDYVVRFRKDLHQVFGKEPSFIEAMEKIKKRGELVPEDSPLYQDILIAIKEKNMGAFENILRGIGDEKYLVTFHTVKGTSGSFFLNRKALNSIRSAITMPTYTITEEMTSDYAYNFTINPISSIKVRDLNVQH